MSKIANNLTKMLIVLGLSLAAVAQTPNDSSSDLQKQVDQAQALAKIAQARKDAIVANQQALEAQQATFKDKLGSVDTSNAPKGTITTDKVVIEANYLAYAAASSAAVRIADALGDALCSHNVAFYTGKDQDAIQAYIVLKQQLDEVQKKIDPKKISGPITLRPVPSSVLPKPEGGLEKLYKFEAAKTAISAEAVQSQQSLIGGLPTPADAAAVINAAMGLISLFRVDTTFTGVSVTADDVALQALVAYEIQQNCQSPKSQPQLFHPTFSYTTAGSSALIKQIQSLVNTADTLKTQAAELDQFVAAPLAAAIVSTGKTRDNIAALDADLKTIAEQLSGRLSRTERAKLLKLQADDTTKRKNLADQLRNDAKACGFSDADSADVPTLSAELIARYQADQSVAQEASAPLKAMASRVSDLITTVSKAGSNGVPPIDTILRAERLQEGLGDKSYILMTKIVSIGGNNINKKNIFWSTLSFSGGIVAEYLLNNQDGAIVQSGTLECYGGRVKEGDFKKGVNPANSIACSGVAVTSQMAQTTGTSIGVSGK